MYTEKASKDPAHFAQMWLVLAIAARDAASKVCKIRNDINNTRAVNKWRITPSFSSAHDISFANYNGGLRFMA
jgi:hypothetical protein